MDIGAYAEKLMSMDDAAWARHTNPWSGWTRVATFPLLTIAIWSREWIGMWAWLAVIAVILWTWLNPRLFPAPKSTDNWMSRGVLGERIWLARYQTPIPKHHADAANLLNIISSIGIIPYIYGLIFLDIWPTVFGMTVSMMAKLWFVDRMAQLTRETDHIAARDDLKSQLSESE